jgi:4-hydroxyacetophenone monooxygenase
MGPGRQALDHDRLREGLEVANIPTLLPVLFQLTGDPRWITERYRPQRAKGTEDNDSGGLSPEVQREIRAAAFDAIVAWHDGRPLAVPDPSDELAAELLATSVAEPIPDEYGEFVAAQVGRVAPVRTDPVHLPSGWNVIVIGAGLSGLCAAVHLRAAGVPFEVIEQNSTVGGVWWENRYPGAGVDSPNHLYTFSFFPHDWKHFFCARDEIHAYLEKLTEHFELRPRIRFNTQVVATSWDGDRRLWQVRVKDAAGSESTLTANVVISAAGLFNPPAEPVIPGLAEWAGDKWHSAQWPEGTTVEDKRVAIIGNGASAMQIGPAIQHAVRSLTVYQRSAQWVAPFEKFRQEVPPGVRYLLREIPLYRAWYRARLGWIWSDRLYSSLYKDSGWDHPERSLNKENDAHRRYFTRYMADELGDRANDLLPSCLPTYPPYGKRMLLDNGWFRMLRNPNVELVTSPITQVSGNSIVTADGTQRDADIIVFATGFDVARMLSSYDVIGRSGRTLRETWEGDNASAYLGTAVPDFPNFFILYGPNQQTPYGSLMLVIEMHTRYIMDVLRQMGEAGADTVEVRPEVHNEFTRAVDTRHDSMVWSHQGMRTYYRNSRGRVTGISPYRIVDVYHLTKRADLTDYVVETGEAEQLTGARSPGST